jgi:hypothetical protein
LQESLDCFVSQNPRASGWQTRMRSEAASSDAIKTPHGYSHEVKQMKPISPRFTLVKCASRSE